MTWLTSLRDQLPLLMVLSPVIGFVVTWAASRLEPRLIRPFALSNMLCTLVILGGVAWQFELELSADAAVMTLAEHELTRTNSQTETLSEARRTLDRMRTERLRYQWFAVDGINLFPLLLVVVLSLVVACQPEIRASDDRWFIPMLMLFESTAIGVLVSYDVRMYLYMSFASAVTTAVLIGMCGSLARRNHAEQFLMSQFCGGVLVALGFAMLVISVPWMKIPDATSIPSISWNIASIVQDIQKWTIRNELAFHYESEVFPWLLLLLSIGFAVQSGLFPFHVWQIRILNDSQPAVAVLYLAGSWSACRVAWLRFVMPLAPDLLVAFDWWLLVPSLAGAVWGALQAITLRQARQRISSVFMSLSAISLFGCYTFTRWGMSGAWLMQQQLTIFMSLALLSIDSRSPVSDESSKSPSRSAGISWSRRTLMLWIWIPILGLFISGHLIVSELILESLPLVAGLFIVALLIATTILSLLNQFFWTERNEVIKKVQQRLTSATLMVIGLLAVVVSICPSWLLHQCDPEFGRVFRRFEQTTTANSADLPTNERHPVATQPDGISNWVK